MSQFYGYNCFGLRRSDFHIHNECRKWLENEEFFVSGKWITGGINADTLYKIAKFHYDDEKKAEDMRTELMKFRMENKRDMLTGESLE